MDRMDFINREIERDNAEIKEKYKDELRECEQHNKEMKDKEEKYNEKLAKLSAEVWGALSEKLQETICAKGKKSRDDMVKFPEIYLPLISISYRNSKKQPKASEFNELVGRYVNLNQSPTESLIRYQERIRVLWNEIETCKPGFITESELVEKALEGADKKFQPLRDEYKNDIDRAIGEDEVEAVYPKTIKELFDILQSRSDNLSRRTQPTGDSINLLKEDPKQTNNLKDTSRQQESSKTETAVLKIR